jgi:hypothetical protein
MTRQHPIRSVLAAAASVAGAAVACAPSVIEPTGELEPAALLSTDTRPGDSLLYVAELLPLNMHLTDGATAGRSTFIMKRQSDRFQVNVEMQNVPPGMHLQHLHGFADKPAICPTVDADRNKDGVIDASEAHLYAGPGLIPLNHQPAALDPTNRTYPIASDNRFSYGRVMPASKLSSDLSARGYRGIHLEQRVVLLHGVAADTELPDSVSTLPGATRAESVPIACGVIVRVR